MSTILEMKPTATQAVAMKPTAAAHKLHGRIKNQIATIKNLRPEQIDLLAQFDGVFPMIPESANYLFKTWNAVVFKWSDLADLIRQVQTYNAYDECRQKDYNAAWDAADDQSRDADGNFVPDESWKKPLDEAVMKALRWSTDGREREPQYDAVEAVVRSVIADYKERYKVLTTVFA